MRLSREARAAAFGKAFADDYPDYMKRHHLAVNDIAKVAAAIWSISMYGTRHGPTDREIEQELERRWAQ